jgi:hypothetical protein
MADTLKFRGGSTTDIASSTVSDREIIFDTDKNTLVLGSAKDYLMRYGGNTQTNFVGIGVASPSTALEVNGTVTATTFAGSLTGNANTATTLQTARSINGISFNGSSDIVIGNIPQNARTSAYTLVSSDAGKHISITTGGVTVPSGVFSIGDAISIYNNSNSDQTITQGSSVTLREAGSTATGTRTLARYGLCTVLCVSSNVFVVTGVGVS